MLVNKVYGLQHLCPCSYSHLYVVVRHLETKESIPVGVYMVLRIQSFKKSGQRKIRFWDWFLFRSNKSRPPSDEGMDKLIKFHPLSFRCLLILNPFPNWNDGLSKPTFTSGNGWVITPHCCVWMWLYIHVFHLILVLLVLFSKWLSSDVIKEVGINQGKMASMLIIINYGGGLVQQAV